VNYHT